MIGTRKGIYHSTLVGFGPAYVTITSDPMPSRKGDGSKYIYLEHEGMEQSYNIENEECCKALSGRKGQSLTIRGTGSREDARIEVEGADSTTVAPAQEKQATGPSLTPSKPSAEEAVGSFKRELQKVLNAFYIIETGVISEEAIAALVGISPNQDNFGGKCGSAFRFLDSQGLVRNLPSVPVWADKKTPVVQ